MVAQVARLFLKRHLAFAYGFSTGCTLFFSLSSPCFRLILYYFLLCTLHFPPFNRPTFFLLSLLRVCFYSPAFPVISFRSYPRAVISSRLATCRGNRWILILQSGDVSKKESTAQKRKASFQLGLFTFQDLSSDDLVVEIERQCRDAIRWKIFRDVSRFVYIEKKNNNTCVHKFFVYKCLSMTSVQLCT